MSVCAGLSVCRCVCVCVGLEFKLGALEVGGCVGVLNVVCEVMVGDGYICCGSRLIGVKRGRVWVVGLG